MDVTRRQFLRLGTGAAAGAVISGLGLLAPTPAQAVIGIDDAALGGLVLLVATLGGYAVSRAVANGTLEAMGYGFSDFVSDANRQSAAVTQAIADANNMGVELDRARAEQAATAIASGTGFFADVMGDAVESGRVALDGFISGAGELPAVLRTLVSQYISSVVGADGYVRALPEYTTWGSGGYILFPNTIVMPPSAVRDFVASRVSTSVVVVERQSYVLVIRPALFNGTGNTAGLSSGSLYCFDEFSTLETIKINDSNYSIRISATNGYAYRGFTGSVDSATIPLREGGTFTSYNDGFSSSWIMLVSSDLVLGGALPAVDRAADAPAVIGPGYDSLPLGNDLVINGDDEVVSAGTLPLPTGIPDVWGDYAGTLADALAGVVPGTVSIPVPGTQPVVVSTAEGVATMPISDAIATDTSLGVPVDPPYVPPVSPIVPPVTVPDGPWVPAVTLPFERVWPFNMIYSMLGVFSTLGGGAS